MRRITVLGLAVCLLLSAVSAAAAAPRWKKRLSKLTSSRTVSVRFVRGDKVLLDKRSGWKRTPASNEKLLLSMALLDRLGPEARFKTTALSDPQKAPLVGAGGPSIREGVLQSNLYVTGRGDPTISSPRAPYARYLTVEPTRVGDLARQIRKAGVTRVDGHVVGVKSYFAHDWFAPGWKSSFPQEQIALPSALTVNGNVRRGYHTSNPEWLFARALTRKLESMKIWVKRKPKSGRMPGNAVPFASVESRPLRALLGHMNRRSSNFFAEVLGKALAVDAGFRPGTIADGAKALRKWTDRRGVRIRAHDGSGLSYRNRVSARGIVKLLRRAEGAKWGDELFESLPKGGWGTLEDRLKDVRLRAKTGTLERVSALSGWLWLEKSQRWARFSILIDGQASWDAKAAEDEIVRIVASHF